MRHCAHPPSRIIFADGYDKHCCFLYTKLYKTQGCHDKHLHGRILRTGLNGYVNCIGLYVHFVQYVYPTIILPVKKGIINLLKRTVTIPNYASICGFCPTTVFRSIRFHSSARMVEDIFKETLNVYKDTPFQF